MSTFLKTLFPLLLVGAVIAAGVIPPAVAADPASAPTSAPPVTLHYKLYAGGLDVVGVDVEYALSPKNYTIHASSRTRGMWETLVPWRNMITSRGVVKADGSVRPVTAKYDAVWREKLRTVEMDFPARGGVVSRSTPPQKPDGRQEATPEQLKTVMDPLSAVVSVLARGGEKGCTGRIPAFDGRRVYNLVLTNKGRETLKPNRYSLFAGEATRCEVTFEPVAGFPVKEKAAGFWNAKDNAQGRKPLVLWLARPRADLPEIPVRMQSTVQLGTLVAHLARMTPDPR